MPELRTKYFGTVTCDDSELFQFPLGLPAFEGERSFMPLELPGTQPLLFLQSVLRPELCFLCFPVLVVDSKYKLAVPCDDLVLLGLRPGRQPALGSEVLVLALLSVQDHKPITANLMAPIVVNPKNRRAVQSIRVDNIYSHQHGISGSAQGRKYREKTC